VSNQDKFIAPGEGIDDDLGEPGGTDRRILQG
jgi:hypothetical protein